MRFWVWVWAQFTCSHAIAESHCLCPQRSGNPPGGVIMSSKWLLVAAVVVGVASGTALAQSDDPLIGTWRLNVEKSKPQSFKSGTTVIERAGDGVKFTVDLAGADGTAYHWTFTAKYDGKDYPATGNS